jgi:hypothetical protein
MFEEWLSNETFTAERATLSLLYRYPAGKVDGNNIAE